MQWSVIFLRVGLITQNVGFKSEDESASEQEHIIAKNL